MATKFLKLAAVPTGLALTSFTLYAIREREPEGSLLLKPNQLSIYSVPLRNSKYVEEQPSPLQLGLSTIRNTVHPYVAWCQNVCVSVKDGVENTIQFGKDIFVYLNDPPPEFLPKLTLIIVSGLTGLVLARRGSQFKKIAYPWDLPTVGLSLCYPAQTVIFAKVTGKKVYAAGHWTYETIGSFWITSPSKNELLPAQENDAKLSSDPQEKPASFLDQDHKDESYKTAPYSELKSEPLKTSAVSKSSSERTHIQTEPVPSPTEMGQPDANPEQAVTLDNTKERRFKPDTEMMDHGQSHPEDIDMYSTRS
ncbi:MICOS complex subunit MIC27 isoform X2 [Rhinatrema bivittatum]|uniref:MICOS complex subunit MIC27 isoform X2 n=1 Tax=Rhinatrema bivittatum TaxID=194408 RepID=UPI00112E98E4|nr:MICOS complex subunit MIC27 isoform X2 [Rhinatrema bivittatum]